MPRTVGLVVPSFRPIVGAGIAIEADEDDEDDCWSRDVVDDE